MTNPIGASLQAGSLALRFGWYFGLNRVVSWRTASLAPAQRYTPRRPVPTQAEVLASLVALFLRDAEAVREGLYPPDEAPLSLSDLLARTRAMLSDLPEAVRRREARNTASVRSHPDAGAVPSYYAQDFHFQAGGYLSEDSAQLYDVQVETLFYGAAAPMRREALRPIAEYMRGRDQRRVHLLDVACGTGRFLRDVRRAWPAMRLTGLDLSASYLREARRHMGDLRPAAWLAGNAEAIPLPDASQDIVTAIFLFHELPPEVRRRVAAEMARVLRPGGLLIFVDSLQMGDRPGWDGLLEAFPVRFHEPYYRHYSVDDLDAMFTAAGLAAQASWTSFLAKVLVRTKP